MRVDHPLIVVQHFVLDSLPGVLCVRAEHFLDFLSGLAPSLEHEEVDEDGAKEGEAACDVEEVGKDGVALGLYQLWEREPDEQVDRPVECCGDTLRFVLHDFRHIQPGDRT